MQSDRPELHAVELSQEFKDAYDKLTGTDRQPDSLGEAVVGFARAMSVEDVTVTVEDMYRSEPTRHAVHLDGNVEHVPCVLDALVAALLVEPDPVEIRSESPATGETIVSTVAEDEITVSPDSAVFSIGIAGDADSVESLDEDSIAGTTCQYINAFRDETGFREWREQVSDVAVMQLDAGTMTALAMRAADELVTTEQ